MCHGIGENLDKDDLPYKKGEKVVYPAAVVAVIDDIQSRTISGTSEDFTCPNPRHREDDWIMIPTETSTPLGCGGSSVKICKKIYQNYAVSAR